jgi:membrane protein implicated in regulation of membrane protease activity
MEITPAMFYLIIAVALIGAELIIMQFSVFWFLFFGIGALVASVAGWILPDLSWFSSTVIFLVASIAIALALYPMLKKWQDKPAPIAGNDAIGQSVKVLNDISAANQGEVVWSGSKWPAQVDNADDAFESGDTAVIRRLEGIRLIIGKPNT